MRRGGNTLSFSNILAVVLFLFSQQLNELGQQAAIARTQDRKPSIEVSCELHDIHDDPKEEAFYAMVRFRWTARNTSYVLISGFDERQYPTEGTISVEEGGSFTFIAVSASGLMAQKPIRCIHQWEKGTGIHGLKHNVGNQFQSQPFDTAYKITVKTALNDDEIKDRVSRLLQERQYTAVIDNFSPRGDLLFHTDDYNYHPSLCYGDDCSLQVGQRRIERQAAFSIWMKALARQNNTTTFQVNIRPFVMMNFRRQDNNWKVDPDATQIANRLSQELAEVIERRLR